MNFPENIFLVNTRHETPPKNAEKFLPSERLRRFSINWQPSSKLRKFSYKRHGAKDVSSKFSGFSFSVFRFQFSLRCCAFSSIWFFTKKETFLSKTIWCHAETLNSANCTVPAWWTTVLTVASAKGKREKKFQEIFHLKMPFFPPLFEGAVEKLLTKRFAHIVWLLGWLRSVRQKFSSFSN
jgi:hypothetical protein